MRRLPVTMLTLFALGCPAEDDSTATGVDVATQGMTTTPGTTSENEPSTSGATTAGPGSETSTTSVVSTTMAETTDGLDTTGVGPTFDVGGGETGSEDCTPVSDTETTCDGIDDDCNGFVDDIDEGGDGICDCLAIAIVGTPGGLASSEFQQWLIDRGSSAERIDPAVVDATLLDAYDVVILDQLTREYTAAEATAFDTWVSAGGGLMSMTGHTASPISAQLWPNTILGPMGLTYEGALLDGPVTDFEIHPITVGLTSVTFLGGFEVVAENPAANDVVGRLPGGAVAGMAQERAAGKLFVWGDEWIEYDSEWESLPEITQLWVNIFEWITPTSLCLPPPG